MKTLTIYEMSIIVFFTQIIFLWLRVLNIRYIAAKNTLGAVVSGNGVAIAWMVGIAIGANAMMEGHMLPIIMHLIGGSIGTYVAMRGKVRKFSKRSRGKKNIWTK